MEIRIFLSTSYMRHIGSNGGMSSGIFCSWKKQCVSVNIPTTLQVETFDKTIVPRGGVRLSFVKEFISNPLWNPCGLPYDFNGKTTWKNNDKCLWRCCESINKTASMFFRCAKPEPKYSRNFLPLFAAFRQSFWRLKVLL